MTDTGSNRPLRVFLCHASSDKPTVRELHHRLTADGFAPWLDEEDLLPGHDWQYEIPRAVRQSDVVMVEIPYDYWIARYPVTNEQFARFVTASKHNFDQGRWQTQADHPVVAVSRQDAMAYCRWLDATLRGELKDLMLRLPVYYGFRCVVSPALAFAKRSDPDHPDPSSLIPDPSSLIPDP